MHGMPISSDVVPMRTQAARPLERTAAGDMANADAAPSMESIPNRESIGRCLADLAKGLSKYINVMAGGGALTARSGGRGRRCGANATGANRLMKRRAEAAAERSAGTALVVWDFDWSLINENSDTYVVHQLDPSGRIWNAAERKLRGGIGWTELMDWAVGELHAAGHAPSAIHGSLAAVPVLDGALQAVAAASAAGAEQRILSDANTVYIGSVLESRGLAREFADVVTNPASFDEAGRLRVSPHQPANEPHRCPNCPPNLCKGAVLARWLDELAPATCVYVGDGGGDYCPATRLRAGDTLLARQAPHDGLLRKCRAAPRKVRAHVVEWGGAADAAGEALHRGMEAALKR
jgi:pyridoxal phosphate phosphatase PHOSPHO2